MTAITIEQESNKIKAFTPGFKDPEYRPRNPFFYFQKNRKKYKHLDNIFMFMQVSKRHAVICTALVILIS